MELEIYNRHRAEEYETFLEVNDIHLDIYYSSKFLQLDAELQGGEFEIAVATNKNEHFIYPYIKISFEGSLEGYYDISSPYGYCGPYATSEKFLVEAEKLFILYASKSKFVTEFVRYHFLYNQENKFENQIKNLQNRRVVLLDLKASWEDIWMKEFSSTNRNLVRKLEKEGFTFSISATPEPSAIKSFVSMYNETMKHANADEFYYFPEQYYYDLFQALKGNIYLASVKKDDEIYSSSLFFLESNMVNYYLSARNLNFSKIPAGNFLLSKTVEWAKQQGAYIFNFGGGTTNDEKDFLFRYKRNFSKTETDFYIGKRIHDLSAYEALKDKFVKDKGIEKFENVKHILQFYRS